MSISTIVNKYVFCPNKDNSEITLDENIEKKNHKLVKCKRSAIDSQSRICDNCNKNVMHGLYYNCNTCECDKCYVCIIKEYHENRFKKIMDTVHKLYACVYNPSNLITLRKLHCITLIDLMRINNKLSLKNNFPDFLHNDFLM